jgi:hypothetical protein
MCSISCGILQSAWWATSCRRTNKQHSQHAAHHNYAVYSQAQCTATPSGPIASLNPNTQSNLSDHKRSNKTNISDSCSKKAEPETTTTREKGIILERPAVHTFCFIRHAKVAKWMVSPQCYRHCKHILYIQQLPLFSIIKHCVYNLFYQRNVTSHARWPAECCQLLPQSPHVHPHALFSNYRHIAVSNLVTTVSFSTHTHRHFYFPNSCLSKH